MGKIAFVFSGQGDQFPGMGKELAENYTVASDIYKMCDKLRPGTIDQCFNGTDEELKNTENTQPCMFAMELSGAAILKEKGIVPDAVAGFSLGEVVALAFSEAVTYEDGFKLVCERGKLMQQAADSYETAMAAVVKLTNEQVEKLCAEYENVYPVNYNCPGQVSVSGTKEEMAAFSVKVKAEGGRAIPLRVKGAFHSPFMKGASESFMRVLDSVDVREPKVTLYSNVTAMPYTDNRKELLAKQISSPVRWEQIIRNMIASGVDTFIEMGPGKTLTNMIGKIDGSVKAYSISDLPMILSEVKPC